MSQAVIEHREAARDKLDIAVVTISDTRTLATDSSGALIVELATENGHRIVARDHSRRAGRDDSFLCQAVRGRGA